MDLHTNSSAGKHDFTNLKRVHWNLSPAQLYEEVIRRDEGHIGLNGPLVVTTGHHTGRSPNDKFIVQQAPSADQIWWGKVNRPMEPDRFEILQNRLLAYAQNKELYVQDCYAGADPQYRLPIRVITEFAWHSLFARNMFIPVEDTQASDHHPQFTVIDIPSFKAVPEIDGTRTEVFIVLNFEQHLVLIGGTEYGGEIKKSIFTALNYLLPQHDVLPMHCSANMGPGGDTAIFFGLSGTGKTTLSADPNRTLIGDDEHGWSERGVFNFEGGCYAKVIHLSPTAEPEIYATTRTFGTVLENVVMDPLTGRLDLDDETLTENTRSAYPIRFIPNATLEGQGGHPKNIVMLTADAFGVLPPIARLTPAQAMYHFLSGYTAKIAGTEKGVTEPQATFSACFGAPFLPLPPATYARMLGERIEQYSATVWLINTGWSGGPYGTGQRMKIAYTRAMVHAALNGALADVPTRTDPIFGLVVPTSCPNVPQEVLDPRGTWADPAAYDAQAHKLAAMFSENFKTHEDTVAQEVRQAGPQLVAQR